MERTILHVDMDAFFASVEQHDHPEWRGRPVVVGARPDERGVVAAASYEARRFGIHSAMPSRDAGRLCPDAVFTPVNMPRYLEVSERIQACFRAFTPNVEPLSVDEAFLDVTGARRLFGDGPEIARRIKQAVRDATGLTASVGVAGNKFLAKLASDLEKPDGLTVAPRGRAAVMAFLAPLSVDRLWGVGVVTGELLRARGLRTIGDLQTAGEGPLAAVVGRHAARHLLRLAAGEDAREVEPASAGQQISREHTFPRDVRDPAVVAAMLADLADDVGRQLREGGRYAGAAHLKLRWASFKTLTRRRSLAPPCCDDFSLRRTADLLLRAEPLDQPVRLVGFGVSRLTAEPDPQLPLFPGPDADARHTRLSRTVDRIRRDHGEGSIRRGSARA